MQKTILILFFGMLMTLKIMAQNPLEQQLDFVVQDQAIAQALQQLAEESKTAIAFSSRFFKGQKKVSLNVKAQTIDQILKQLLRGTNIAYKVNHQQIILYKKEAPPLPKRTLSGFIEDAETGERLVSANVFCEALGKGTVSNEYGFYSLTLATERQTITFSYLGYEVQRMDFDFQEHQKENIALSPSLMLSEVVVTPTLTGQVLPDGLSSTTIPLEKITYLPDLAGEADVLQMVQTLPGVQTGADGFGGLHIRGGNSDQNLILIDGVPVYNFSHIFGIYSIFNTNAIKDVKLIKGAFPARYGGRLSSVLDVRTKEGNQKKFSGEVGLSLLSLKTTLETPFAKKRGAIIFSARSTHHDFFVEKMMRNLWQLEDTPGKTFNYFYDINLKVNYQLSKKDRLFLSYYNGRDVFFQQGEEQEDYELYYENGLTWANSISALRWNRLFGDRFFVNTTLTSSRYDFENGTYLEVLDENFSEEEGLENEVFYTSNSAIRNSTIKIDAQYLPSPHHEVRFGAGFTEHQFESGNIVIDEPSIEFMGIEEEDLGVESIGDSIDFPVITGTEWYGYLEDDWQIGTHWQANIGLRMSRFVNGKDKYHNLEPRLSLQRVWNEQWRFNTSFSRMIQYVNLTNTSSFGLPDDIWELASAELPPQEAWQTSIGAVYEPSSHCSIQAEAWYKKLNNLNAVSNNWAAVEDIQDVETFRFIGQGWSYGLEWWWRQQMGNMNWMFSYTLSWSKRQFPDLNLGRVFADDYDRRHLFHLNFQYQANKRLSLAGHLIWGSANPEISAKIDFFSTALYPIRSETFGQRNTIRAVPYHRMDLSAVYYWPTPKGTHIFKGGFYNVYNQKNPAFYRTNVSTTSGVSAKLPVSLLDFMPSFSYHFKF